MSIYNITLNDPLTTSLNYSKPPHFSHFIALRIFVTAVDRLVVASPSPLVTRLIFWCPNHINIWNG